MKKSVQIICIGFTWTIPWNNKPNHMNMGGGAVCDHHHNQIDFLLFSASYTRHKLKPFTLTSTSTSNNNHSSFCQKSLLVGLHSDQDPPNSAAELYAPERGISMRNKVSTSAAHCNSNN